MDRGVWWATSLWDCKELDMTELLVLFLLTVWSFSIFGYKEYNQSELGVDRLVMSMCRVVSCIVGRRCLLWPVRSLGKTLLAFALLHFVLQGQACLLLQVSLDFLLLHSSPLWWKGYLFLVSVLEGFVGLHRTGQLQFLWHQWLGHRLELLWCWMACLENKQIILLFLRLYPNTAFQTLVDYKVCSISSNGLLLTVVDIMILWIKFSLSCLF